MKYTSKANLLVLFSVFFSFIIAVGCNKSAPEPDPEYINLADGIYYLNGTDENYQVRRKGVKELYQINPNPIFNLADIESIDIIEEENGKFSLSVSLLELLEFKWKAVLKSEVHYVGYIANNNLIGLIKIKGENARDDVYLSCVAKSKEEAETLAERFKKNKFTD